MSATFINEIAAVCEQVGADIGEVDAVAGAGALVLDANRHLAATLGAKSGLRYVSVAKAVA